MKSTVDEIRARFDADVERFSNLETGQSATVDAPLVLDLIAEASSVVTPAARSLLDIGCGAGNYTLKLLTRLPSLNCTLLDLSRSMLNRAVERVGQATTGSVTAVQADIRSFHPPSGSFDVIVAAAVLHHLRDDQEWSAVFGALHRMLRPGGSVWISDLVSHDHPGVQNFMWRRYGQYLSDLKGGGEVGEQYRDHVLAYVEKEDSPRSLEFQLQHLRAAGFRHEVVLHKNGCFAAFGAMRE